jgi:integrase
LWARADIPLRERTLWRLLYDSAARAEEVVGLDVGDLDLANRQAWACTKGGHTRPLHFQTATARLLARLTAGRDSGPVFLTARRAAAHRVMAAADLDPASGRAGCRMRWPSSCSRATPAARPCTSCATPG